ncbi:NADPH-dependent FMN reductase [uncultured Paraburkholderia sp.]|uniref:NADPH-dependent FMN reductase n=1 Tax=uncultured Paraburkholderia sp. TaxID=1822466 RepID=UPI00259383C1|nr:NADPH-dependent FMN reductase [uncultured Paraburkholderia sp.]
MNAKKVLVLSGSTRPGSLNRKLAEAVAAHLRGHGMEVTFPETSEYELPIYSGRIEEQQGIPEAAHRLHDAIRTHRAIFIASPEYNANVSPLVLNAVAWLSRIRENGGMQAAFGNPVYAIGSASPGGFGGYRGLMALRNTLELGVGARVLPAMISVGMANQAFNEQGEITSPVPLQMLETMTSQLKRALNEI